ncbi:MAG: ThiF family adenylyltransferase [Kofleriaceae bacterium]
MTTAREENARTLAAAIGITEEAAEQLLDATVLVTCAPGGERLAGYIERLLARTLTKVTSDPSCAPCVEVVVGKAAQRSNARVINVGVDAYRILVTEQPMPLGPRARPIVELVAACYASAAAVQRAINAEFPVQVRMPIDLDLATLYGDAISRLDGRIDLDVSYMAGAGAIGNAVLAGFSMLDVHGELHVCDPDNTSDGNLNRCWWFESDDLGLHKAERLEQKAQGALPHLRLVPHVATLHDTVESLGKPLETLIVGVDSPRARRSLQSEMPRRVFDASTSGIVEFVMHFNETPSSLACMSCIYYEAPDEFAHEEHIAELLGVSIADVRSNFVTPEAAKKIAEAHPGLDPANLEGQAYSSLFKQHCGKGPIRSGTADRVLAPFGFVSVLAGVMLAIEIALRVSGSPPEYNYWRIGPWSSPVVRMRETRSKRWDCEFCGNPTLQSVANELWNTSRRNGI